MNLLLTILVLVILVSAIAFWKDIKNLSAKRKKTASIGNRQLAIGKAKRQEAISKKENNK